MKKSLISLALTFVLWLLVFALARVAFCLIYHTPVWPALLHGRAHDAAVAAYLTVLPALLAIAGVWTRNKWLRICALAYGAVVALMCAVIIVADLVLYGYWGFRLDMTPVFYFTSSPSAAMASATWWQLLLMPVAIVALAAAIFLSFRAVFIPAVAGDRPTRRPLVTAVLTLLTAALFIPIRGGFTVSTMNMSYAYYSNEPLRNHAAINPAFSLLYSATHQDHISEQFRYFDDTQLRQILADINAPVHTPDTLASVHLTTPRPDIYLIILESFSSHLFPSLGGEAIAVRLDSLARRGVLFTRFYASSFRTDRALPAILSALPSQPTMSVMKSAERAEHLPSLAAELKRQAGYRTIYYYGGDINFTNQKAYLQGTGYDSIVCDRDFDAAQRRSKWGAHDDVLLQRVLADEHPAAGPRLTVIQTSSSHEPFQVPRRDARFPDNDRANSLAFTDAVVTDFVNAISAVNPRALFVIVPDHWGTWPLRDSLPRMPHRHRIPLILAGPAVATPGVRIADVGSQPDIAATLMGLMGLDAAAFPFSRDMLHASSAPRAYISEPEFVAWIDSNDSATQVTLANDHADGNPAMANRVRAWLQNLYDYIDAL